MVIMRYSPKTTHATVDNAVFSNGEIIMSPSGFLTTYRTGVLKELSQGFVADCLYSGFLLMKLYCQQACLS